MSLYFALSNITQSQFNFFPVDMSALLHTENWELPEINPDKAFFSDVNTTEEELQSNETNAPTEAYNNTLFSFLLNTAPNYIEMVPYNWLQQDQPSYNIQTFVAILFLIICVPANIGQILIFVAYGRYTCLFNRF